jgi:hypothetical protein
MYLQSIKSVKHNAAKSVNRSILKKSRHIGFGVFIVHSSMTCIVIHICKNSIYQRGEDTGEEGEDVEDSEELDQHPRGRQIIAKSREELPTLS